MRFLRLKETRPTASMVAVAAWVLGSLLLVTAGRMLMDMMPLLALSTASVLPMLAMLLPSLLAYIALRAGRLAAMACAAAGIVVCGAALGVYAALLATMTLVPAAAFSVYSYERKLPFWLSVGVSAGLLLGAGILALWMLNALSGGDVVTALRALLDPLVHSAPAPETDATLKGLAGMGLVRMPESALPAMQAGAAALDEPIREELIKQFLFSSENLLRKALPSQILQGSIFGGVLSVAWPRRVAARYATQMEPAPLPPFHEWYIPARLFRPVALTVLGAGLLMLLSGARSMISLVDVLWAGGGAVMALQGGALLAFLMRKGGIRAPLRMAAVVALLVLLQRALFLLGFADQFLNTRALRKPPHDQLLNKRDEEGDR
ncbi:MAG: DUF2232 domain-containing protein [Clostridia bacterium]|nr:DUF2232 domain-containing protein [Clostridia bacterium]